MLVDLEKYQEEKDRIIAEFDKKIADLEAEIATLSGEIVDVEGQISLWSGQVSYWRARWQTSNTFAQSLDVYNPIGALKFYWIPVSIALQYLNTWGVEAVEGLASYRRILEAGETPADIKEQWGKDYVKIVNGTPCLEVYVITSPTTLARTDTTVWPSQADDQRRVSQESYLLAQGELAKASDTLESKTRHMRDLELAKEAAEEETRGALALWGAEYQAALERKRIEIASIGRDLELGYPTMDAETAQSIAQMAYADALARGFTRLSDAVRIAGDLADEWADKPVIPHYTTRTIFCPACGIKLEITSSDIETDNRDLSCPKCGASVGRGIQVRIIEVEPIPPIPPTPPIAGAWDWLKKYAPWVSLAILGALNVYAVSKTKRGDKNVK